MTDHPITPPPELVEQWYEAIDNSSTSWKQELATQAARWGADQELEACCELVRDSDGYDAALGLRAERRPSLPSLKKQAQAALGRFFSNAHTQASQMTQDFEIIRRAPEALDD